MTWRALGTFLLGLSIAVPAVASAGAGMTHVVFRFVSPDIKAGSFAATSREAWRVGATYLRLEEAPNPEDGAHTLIIANSPDAWLINRATSQGQHHRGEGKQKDLVVPVFPTAEPVAARRLELGEEVAFFRAHDARMLGERTINGVRTTASQVKFSATTLTLYTRGNGHPYQVAIHSPVESYAVRYEVYETGLEPDWSLFRPPPDVDLQEVQP